ncbi:uncharacterized protein QC761_102580 [Podospora bellae-mahoneyi]|uniref:DUF7732 domain-containing protein n=1 Tax=Podospora bellae-mahoneyi TaxID=2093777 RepID=A0ABR0FWS8_9PEZI|nr:hypothetical protein QC761_102580 [Podospora bellae-mahoneyi]
MKVSTFLSALLVADATVHGLVSPPIGEIAQHEPVRHSERDTHSHDDSELWKRRGGGGGGGRGGGGGGGGGSSGSSGSSGGGSSGTSGSGSTGGGGSSGTRGSPGFNSGGRTSTGTGPAPAYGGGRYYGGGAAVPYRAGGRSPTRGVAPLFFGAAFLAFWPGLWLTSAYLYHRPEGYTFYNVTTDQRETKPVICACAEDSVCGCDDNDDEQYMKDLIGNGSYAALDKSVIDVANVNGTSTILINGTLPDGTTAPGGTDAPGSAAGDGLRALLENAGWWPVVATVAAVVFTA